MSSIDTYLHQHGFCRKSRVIGGSTYGFAWFKFRDNKPDLIVEPEDGIAIFSGDELLFCTNNISSAILYIDEILGVHP